MMKLISVSELDTLLKKTLTRSNNLHLFSEFYFQDLYYTGCRSKELLAIERWKEREDSYILHTFKTDAIRVFPKHLLTINLRVAIRRQAAPYNGCTYDQLTNEFRRVVPIHPIYAGKKIADTYLFRYNRARQYFSENPNLHDLMDFFGWNSPGIASNYLSTPLEFNQGFGSLG
jgi:hypothetical protein